MTYPEAAQQFGVPNVIKMDIEGQEIEFLGDAGFMSFVKSNNIRLIVEFHDDEYRRRFPECSFIHLNDRTYQVTS